MAEPGAAGTCARPCGQPSSGLCAVPGVVGDERWAELIELGVLSTRPYVSSLVPVCHPQPRSASSGRGRQETQQGTRRGDVERVHQRCSRGALRGSCRHSFTSVSQVLHQGAATPASSVLRPAAATWTGPSLSPAATWMGTSYCRERVYQKQRCHSSVCSSQAQHPREQRSWCAFKRAAADGARPL